MRPKKNFDKDLNRKIGLYFVIGLALILALIYIFLEWKTIDDNHGFDLGVYPKNENSSIVLKRKQFNNETKKT